MSSKYDYLEERLNKMSDRLYEVESELKELQDREVKLIKRLLDAEEMIEQLGDAFTKRGR